MLTHGSQSCGASPSTQIVIVFFLVVSIAMSTDGILSNTGTDVTFEEMKRLSDMGAMNLIDVREPAELAKDGAIPSAVNIPLGQFKDTLRLSPSELQALHGLAVQGQDSEIIVSCRSGRRSTLAAAMARELGYTNVRNYAGGILEWNAKINPNGS
ncbi:thiosulfate:glutathione sulfurtransferase-like [Paramacrobiotus metropolitanus]|uniref:thiosulfate:glutathione sulfurtransferase-like n=1 Tax=Paramacrobiotus metropolitanus TaxID=2943436 RepID=UPI00244632A9|nr:thiosulfate:glutathione sulfurtransferase-like [Paramacrobiotus metropolitanus]